MRVLRAKSVRKYLRFYRLAFRIASPYNIILDGNFIFSALKLKIDIIDRLQKLLQTSSVKLFVLRSVLDELKSVGEKTKSAHAFAEQFCTVLSDEGIQGETPSSRLIAFLGQFLFRWKNLFCIKNLFRWKNFYFSFCITAAVC